MSGVAPIAPGLPISQNLTEQEQIVKIVEEAHQILVSVFEPLFFEPQIIQFHEKHLPVFEKQCASMKTDGCCDPIVEQALDQELQQIACMKKVVNYLQKAHALASTLKRNAETQPSIDPRPLKQPRFSLESNSSEPKIPFHDPSQYSGNPYAVETTVTQKPLYVLERDQKDLITELKNHQDQLRNYMNAREFLGNFLDARDGIDFTSVIKELRLKPTIRTIVRFIEGSHSPRETTARSLSSFFCRLDPELNDEKLFRWIRQA